MKVKDETVWYDDNDNRLLSKNGPDKYTVVPCTVSLAELKALGDVIKDALLRAELQKEAA